MDPKAPSVTREYWAKGSQDVAEINNAIADASPNTFLGMVKKAIKSTPQGGDFWYCTVEYENPYAEDQAGDDGSGDDPPPTPEKTEDEHLGSDFSMEIGGGTVHITQSLSTIARAKRGGGDPQDYKGSIGVTKERVEGVDIIQPKVEISLTRLFSFVTLKMVNNWKLCASSPMNLNPWNTFEGGEALFMGCSLKYQGNNDVNQSFLGTFKFLIIANITEDIVIVPESAPGANDGLKITGGKLGHDYLWVTYGDDVDANKKVKLADAAYVERVYYRSDFKALLGF